ncbi:MAG: redoxin family protein [Planctomycetota bacterium]
MKPFTTFDEMRRCSLSATVIALLFVGCATNAHIAAESSAGAATHPVSLRQPVDSTHAKTTVDSQPGREGGAGNDPVTFNQHIAPMIHEKCSMCHRPGQAGPFSLLTYDDVRKRAQTIDAVIDMGYMPPWKPVNHEVEYVNDRRLSDQQKTMIKEWIETGMPEGDSPFPEPPEFIDGWRLGEPDMIVTMQGAFDVPASGSDVYRSFVFPMQLPEDKWVKAIEYRPTATSAVHHALFFVDEHGNGRSMDGADGQPGIAGMSFLSGSPLADAGGRDGVGGDGVGSNGGRAGGILSRVRQAASGEQRGAPAIAGALSKGLGAYVPGTTPMLLPGDLALFLPAGSDVIMQTHFHPSGKAEVEQGQIALYFADQPPSRQLVQVQIPAMFGVGVGLKVPAGQSDYRISESFEVPVDIELISVGAHAHYICREAGMTATLPDGSTKVLLQIDDWDLDWQDRYYFENPVVLPAGTVLTSELVYDNSADNPENPNSPPRDIRWGRESGDEMGSVTVHAVAVNEPERPQLQQALRRYLMRSVTQGDVIELLMQLDTNRDGGLQPDETPARMSRRFNMLDTNRDGKLEPAELEFIRGFLPQNLRERPQNRREDRARGRWNFGMLDGTSVDPFADTSTEACVLIFVSTDCPIANAYHPELKSIQNQFMERGVRFFLIHSDTGITEPDAAAHAREFELTIPVVLDADQEIARAAGATVTPSAIVLSRESEQPVYSGAIDNLYAGYGRKRPAATEHYLADALAAVLQDREITLRETTPVGCFISFDR